MADQDLLSKRQKEQTSKRKFLFDQHNFDEGPISTEPEPEEPPPSFSEEELAKAGRDSYQKGFQDGQHESETTHERHIADSLEKIAAQFATLFAAEKDRNARYEHEVVHLCHAVFKRAFPALNKTHGLNEVTQIIHKVLETHRETPEIQIEVEPDLVDDIEKRLQKLRLTEGYEGKFTVRGNAACRAGDCKMGWKDGGARRNATRLSEEILKQIEDTLADKPILHDNSGKNVSHTDTKTDHAEAKDNKDKDNNNKDTDNDEHPSKAVENTEPPTDQEMEHKE